MKLVIAVVKNEDAEHLGDTLIKNRFRATKLASTGGFLRVGNTTFLIGVDGNRVDELLDLIRKICSSREQYIVQGSYEFMPTGVQRPIEVTVGGATVFVLNVDQFNKFAQNNL